MGFETPEDAALATWESTPGVEPTVTCVTVRGRRAEVIIEFGEPVADWVYCVRGGDGWDVRVDGNGPVIGWDDPAHIQWSE